MTHYYFIIPARSFERARYMLSSKDMAIAYKIYQTASCEVGSTYCSHVLKVYFGAISDISM